MQDSKIWTRVQSDSAPLKLRKIKAGLTFLEPALLFFFFFLVLHTIKFLLDISCLQITACVLIVTFDTLQWIWRKCKNSETVLPILSLQSGSCFTSKHTPLQCTPPAQRHPSLSLFLCPEGTSAFLNTCSLAAWTVRIARALYTYHSSPPSFLWLIPLSCFLSIAESPDLVLSSGGQSRFRLRAPGW